MNQEKEDLEPVRIAVLLRQDALWSLLRVDPESEALVLYAAGTVLIGPVGKE